MQLGTDCYDGTFILVCSTAWNEPSYPLFQYSGLSSATSSRTGQTGESRSTMFEETQAIAIKGQPTSLTESIQGNPSQLSATITEFPILSGVSNSSSHCSPSTIIIQTTMRTSFFSDRNAVIGVFTAVGAVVSMTLTVLLFVCLQWRRKRRDTAMNDHTPHRDKRSSYLSSRYLASDDAHSGIAVWGSAVNLGEWAVGDSSRGSQSPSIYGSVSPRSRTFTLRNQRFRRVSTVSHISSTFRTSSTLSFRVDYTEGEGRTIPIEHNVHKTSTGQMRLPWMLDSIRAVTTSTSSIDLPPPYPSYGNRYS